MSGWSWFYKKPNTSEDEECALVIQKSKRKRYKRIKRRVARKLYAGTFGVLVIVGLCMGVAQMAGYTNPFDTASHGRRLSGGGGCDYTSIWLNGTLDSPALWGIIYLLFTLYWFIGIAIVCDALNLSPDVAGATFMAAGSSAPELFTSMADTFTTSNNIGIGTIVGSAMFNILIIVAAAAMAAGKDLKIDWRCIARDVGFYGISVAMLVAFFWDDRAAAWEGGLMCVGYGFYVLFMVWNEKLLGMMGNPPSGEAGAGSNKVVPAPTTDKGFAKDNILKEIESGANTQTPASEKDGNENDADNNDTSTEKPEQSKLGNAFKQGLEMGITGDGGAKDDEEESLWDWPDTPVDQFFFILSVPFKVMFFVTIPDCSKPFWAKWYWLTFASCIVWLGVCCAMMANLATAIGCLWGIDAFIMGVVVLAVGTSVPDAMASIIVAKAGEGDMAIANAIGSNVFDILLGLGFPWFLYGVTGFCKSEHRCIARDSADTTAVNLCASILKTDSQDGLGKGNAAQCMEQADVARGGNLCKYMKALEGNMESCVIHRNQDSNLYLDLTILFGTILLFVAALFASKWTMTKKLGQILICIYVLYLLLQAVMQFIVKGCSEYSCCAADEYFCDINNTCVKDCGNDNCGKLGTEFYFPKNPNGFKQFCNPIDWSG
eukprot:g4582.t1